MLRRTFSEKFSMTIIPENDPHCSSKSDLDEAFLEEKPVVIIKDSKLGNKTVLWIRLGECLDKMTLVVAFGSIICSAEVQHNILKYGKPLAITSIVMHIAYTFLWYPEPVMRYNIAQGPSLYGVLREQYCPSTILVRQAQPKRNILRSLMCAVAVISAYWSDVTSYDYKEAFEKMTHFKEKKGADTDGTKAK